MSGSPGMRRPSLFPAEAFPPISCPSGICIHLLWGNSQSWCTSHSLQKKNPLNPEGTPGCKEGWPSAQGGEHSVLLEGEWVLQLLDEEKSTQEQ